MHCRAALRCAMLCSVVALRCAMPCSAASRARWRGRHSGVASYSAAARAARQRRTRHGTTRDVAPCRAGCKTRGAAPCVGAASVRLQQLCCQFTTFAAARLRERAVFAAARAVGNCRFRAFLARGFRAVFAGRFFSLLLGLLVFRGFRHGLLLCFSLVMIPNRYQLAMANSYAG